jgi:hypothetical protein
MAFRLRFIVFQKPTAAVKSGHVEHPAEYLRSTAGMAQNPLVMESPGTEVLIVLNAARWRALNPNLPKSKSRCGDRRAHCETRLLTARFGWAYAAYQLGGVPS